MYDIIIIGAGPAGLTAAIYSKIARKNILIFEKECYGGQIIKALEIKNYPGFLKISGEEFSSKLYDQLKNLGQDINYEKVIEIENYKDYKLVKTESGTYKAKALIIAGGAKNRKLNLPNEDRLLGNGVSYCATCDGMFFKDKVVAIYGGGNHAIDDALYLSNIANKVYLIYRNKDFKIESINLEKIKEKDNVEIILNSSIIKLNGTDKLESITIKNQKGNEKEIKTNGLFIAIGYVPVSEICKNIIDTDNLGYIISNEECKTNVEGIFCAGDIRKKSIRQLTTACSDGTIAAINAYKYVNKINSSNSKN